jgi:hypothetical protein
MSARKWSYYDMEVGKVEKFEKAPKSFQARVGQYGREVGKVFKTKRIGEDVEVRRVS